MTAPERRVIRVGTRGSLLARTQTGHVVAALSAAHPEVEFETVVIRTSGDRALRDVVGAFVKELQESVLSGTVDLAVHSMKDLPTDRPDGLTIGAVPLREDPREALLSAHRGSPTCLSSSAVGAARRRGILADLPEGARIGTGSARRAAQLRNKRPDLQFLPLVGNVDTRMRKLKDGEYDAIVAAMAGLNRLDLRIAHGLLADTGLCAEVLEVDTVLPAPGQGALAVECRTEDSRAIALLQTFDDPETHAAVRAEREFLAGLGGGCQTPVAAYATADGSALRLRGLVASLDGTTVLRGEMFGSIERPVDLGRDLAAELIGRGAQGLLQGDRR